MAEFADDYAAALQRLVAYAPQDLESWNTANIDAALASSEPHIAEHLKTLTIASRGLVDFGSGVVHAW
jgi:hypothetical protein